MQCFQFLNVLRKCIPDCKYKEIGCLLTVINGSNLGRIRLPFAENENSGILFKDVQREAFTE